MKIIVLVVALLVPAAVLAAGWGGGGMSQREVPPPSLQEIKKKIDDRKYSESVTLLKKFVKDEPRNADAWNFLGFSYRKLGDVHEAFKAYQKALSLDPKHLGAHEYLGEAYLQNREPEKARAMLEKLKALCGTCKEYKDLEEDIRRYQ